MYRLVLLLIFSINMASATSVNPTLSGACPVTPYHTYDNLNACLGDFQAAIPAERNFYGVFRSDLSSSTTKYYNIRAESLNGVTGNWDDVFTGSAVTFNVSCPLNADYNQSTGLCDVHACPSGQYVINNNGQCGTCVNGASAGSQVDKTTNTTMQINIGSANFSDGYCQVQCTSQPSATYAPSGYYYKYDSCSKTGLQTQSSDKTPFGQTPPANPITQQPSPTGKTCNTDQTGNNVCVDNTTKALDINGQKVTLPDSTGADATIDGVKVNPTDPKNCVYSSTRVLCVTPGTDPNAQNCGTVNGVKTCFNVKPIVQKNETTTANPDGSITKTTNLTDNVIGDGTEVIQQITHPDGSVTTTTTGGLVGSDGKPLYGISGTGSGTGSGSSNQTDCDKHPEMVGCSGFGTPGADDALETTDALNGLSSFSFTSLGSSSSTSCPTALPIHTSHGDIPMSYQPYCDLATGVKPVVIALFMLVAGFIVSGSVRDN